MGYGPLRFRIEGLARRFVDRTTEPSALLSFAMAGGAASIVGTSALARLSLAAPGMLTRGRVASLLASSASYAVEVPVFVATQRVFHPLFGVEESPSASSLAEDFTSAAIFIGALRFSGGLGGLAANRARWTPPARALLANLGQVGGIYFARRLEEGLEIRPVRSEADRWADVADVWLQMRVGGRLFGRLFPSLENNRTDETLLRQGLLEGFRDGMDKDYPRILALAAARSRAGSEGSERPVQDLNVERLRFVLRERVTRRALDSVRVIGDELENTPQLVNLLAQSRIQVPRVLEIGLLRMASSVSHSHPRTAQGNYLELLTRMALVETVRQGNSGLLDEMILRLNEGGSLVQFEQLLSPVFSQYRIKAPSWWRRAAGRLFSHSALRRIDALPFRGTAREALTNYCRRLLVLDSGGDSLHGNPDLFVETLERTAQHHPQIIPEITRALTAAAASPLPFLRVSRIYRVLRSSPFLYPKLRELSGEGIQMVGLDPLMENAQRTEQIDGLQANGFYDEPRLAGFMAEFFRDLPRYLERDRARLRQEAVRGKLEQIWNRPRPLSNADVIRAFQLLGDPISMEVAAALQGGEVDLQFLSSPEFEALLSSHGIPREPSETWNATMIPPRNPEGRPRIVVRQAQGASTKPFRDLAFGRLALVVHEYEHFRHTGPSVKRNMLEVVRQEMLATQREFHWRMEQGDLIWYRNLLEEGDAGWGMQLRSMVEHWNLDFPIQHE